LMSRYWCFEPFNFVRPFNLWEEGQDRGPEIAACHPS
jgi:hypothetical protein